MCEKCADMSPRAGGEAVSVAAEWRLLRFARNDMHRFYT
jgi:hypothetical protein